MPDYEINHTPERSTVSVQEADGEEKAIGTTIEGTTHFSFRPEEIEYSEDDFKSSVEDVLEGEGFEFKKESYEPYYHVIYTKHDWSHYHLAVQGDDHISLFVRTSTTERSVEDFHNLLAGTTDTDWNVEKNETDLTGSGSNRD